MITIINRLIKNFPTVIIDTYEFTIDSIDTNVIRTKQLLENWIERKYFKVIVLEINFEKNILSQLARYIDFLNRFTPKSVRPKCLIFLIMKTKRPWISLLPFLKYSWKNMFLDITVVEIAEQHQISAEIQRPKDLNVYLICHQYNPFNEKYKTEICSSEIDLFDDKLRHLYGSILRVGFLEEQPHVIIDQRYQGNEIMNALLGVDVSILRIIANKLNLSIHVKTVSDSKFNLTRFNLHYYKEDQALKDSYIDFLIKIMWDTQERCPNLL